MRIRTRRLRIPHPNRLGSLGAFETVSRITGGSGEWVASRTTGNSRFPRVGRRTAALRLFVSVWRDVRWRCSRASQPNPRGSPLLAERVTGPPRGGATRRRRPQRDNRSHGNHREGNHVRPEQNRVVGLSVRIPRHRPIRPLRGGWLLVDQLFAQDLGRVSGGSPPFAIEVSPSGRFRAHVRGGSKNDAYAPAPYEAAGNLGRAKPGVSFDFLIRLRFSVNSDGVCKVWMRRSRRRWRSSPTWSYHGVNVLTVAGDSLPVYIETGLYRSTRSATQVLFYRASAAAPSRAAVVRRLRLAAG